MDHFHYRNHQLYCEDVAVSELAAEYGTPLFVYSQATLLHHLRQLQQAFAPAEPIICYSVKTNGNLTICRLMAQHGAGFDVTSGGELYRALTADPQAPIVFAGVGKTADEMRYALENRVMLFNVESEAELHTLADVAHSLGKVAPVALRVNPALPPKTHIKTDTSVKGTKFGLDIETVLEVAQGVVGRPGVAVVGLHMHLGSPILKTDPYRDGSAEGRHAHRAAAPAIPSDPLSEHGRGLRHPLPQAGGVARQRLCRGHPARRARHRLQADPGAGPLHRRQRGHSGQPGTVHQAFGRQELRHPGRRHERSGAADALRLVPPHLAGRPRTGLALPPRGFRGRHPRHAASGCGRAGLRDGRFPRQRPLPPRSSPRRPARYVQCRCIRYVHEFQLQ
jgi:hypothetical protein